jgi:hypothetical protein
LSAWAYWVAAALSRDLVLAKIRLMWLLTVWLLRTRAAAISGCHAPGDQRQDLGLPGGEPVGQVTGLIRVRRAGSGGGHQCGLDGGIQDRQAAGGAVQGPGDVGAMLFRRQKALEDDDLRRYATGLGLDVALFDHDRASDVVLERVRRDVDSGIASGEVRGTPTLFIDGVVHREATTRPPCSARWSHECHLRTPAASS